MSEEMKMGSICHIEIPAPDLAKAMTFYATVFGWETQAFSGGYAIFRDGVTGGGLDKGMPVGAGGAVPVIACEDIPEKMAEIEAAGGAEVQGKTEIGGGMGYYAYFRDPNGNRMGIWSKT
jgi:predicted enzyme related to lactoylglutathione lyase